MLAAEVIEAEERWITYDDELTEVTVELGDYIYNKLIDEMVDEIVRINVKSHITQVPL